MCEARAKEKQYDAVAVCGGGVLPNGTLPLWVEARLELANAFKGNARNIALLSRGTPHKPPPLDIRKFPLDESRVAARWLLRSSAWRSDQIFMDSFSLDTLGNLLFLRVMFAQPLKWRRLLIITSEFHLQRVRLQADWIFSLTPSLTNDATTSLDFAASENRGLNDDVVAARVAREQRAIISWKNGVYQSVTTVEEFMRWIFTEHQAYAPPPLPLIDGGGENHDDEICSLHHESGITEEERQTY